MRRYFSLRTRCTSLLRDAGIDDEAVAAELVFPRGYFKRCYLVVLPLIVLMRLLLDEYRPLLSWSEAIVGALVIGVLVAAFRALARHRGIALNPWRVKTLLAVGRSGVYRIEGRSAAVETLALVAPVELAAKRFLGARLWAELTVPLPDGAWRADLGTPTRRLRKLTAALAVVAGARTTGTEVADGGPLAAV